MSKGIAITTILLLLVGTIVAGIIIYLVYSTTRGSALSAAECQSRIISWCTTCKNIGWQAGTTMGTLGLECGSVMTEAGYKTVLGVNMVSSTISCSTAHSSAANSMGICTVLGIT